MAEFADRLFDGPLPWAKIHQVHKLLRLGQRHTPVRLQAVCSKVLAVDLIDVRRVERILLQTLEQEEASKHLQPLPAGRFAETGTVFEETCRTEDFEWTASITLYLRQLDLGRSMLL